MVKALGALVISMVLGAFLLAVLEPDRSLPGTRPAILLQAQAAPVPGSWTTHKHQIRTVRVFCVSVSAPKSLNDNSIPEAAHMIVGIDGRLQAGSAPTDAGTDTFLIRVDLPPDAPEFSRRQLQALDNLLARVGREFALPLGALYYDSCHPRLPDLGQHLAQLRASF